MTVEGRSQTADEEGGVNVVRRQNDLDERGA